MNEISTDLLVRATNELAVALDTFVGIEELRTGVWQEALAVLRESDQELTRIGALTPRVVRHILDKAASNATN